MSALARGVLATCFAVLLVNAGARFAMGLVLKPMAEDLGWSRSTLSLAVTVFMVVSALALPFSGRLVDRFGARSVLTAGLALSAVSLVALSFSRTAPVFLALYGVVFALGSACTAITPIGVLLNRWYPHRLGMASSIAISGMGVGQLLVISVLAAVLPQIGWRGAFLALGLAAAALAPLLILTAAKPPPGAGTDGGTAAGPAPSLRAALTSGRVQRLLLLYAICGFQDFLIATHIVAYALDNGIDALVAGNMLAFMGLAGLIGVLGAGAWNDRSGPVPATAACFALRSFIFALTLVSQESVVIITMALLYGATFWVTAPLTVVFARQSVAPQALGTLAGVITMVHHMAGGMGALVAATLFDLLGSYQLAFALLLALSLAATVLSLGLGRGADLPR